MKKKFPNNTNFFLVGAGIMMAALTTLNSCKKSSDTPAPANQSPTVSISSPSNGASFNAPATVNISAIAADANGSISKVEFYNGAVLLATTTVAPYSYSWTNVAAGSYSITAKAYDNSSASTTSSPVLVNVNGYTYNGALCGDTICHLPYRLLPAFLPSGYYNTGDQSTTLTLDSLGETPAYPNEGIRIVYHYPSTNGNYWGASFLNNNNWSGVFNIIPTATKITFKLRIDRSANVTFNAFSDQQYGKVEFYKLATPVSNPVWQDVTIPLSSVPSNFAAPLNVIIDGVTTPGATVVVDIKDLQFE